MKMDDQEILKVVSNVKQFLTGFVNRRYYPQMMKTRVAGRAKYMMSPADAWRWKYILENWAKIPDSDKDQIKEQFGQWYEYLEAFVQKTSQNKIDSERASVSAERFFDSIWEAFKPIVLEGAEKVKNDEKNAIEYVGKRSEELVKKYGTDQAHRWKKVDGDSDFEVKKDFRWFAETSERRFYYTNPNEIPRRLFRVYNDFIDSERAKVANLLGRVFTKVTPTDVRADTIKSKAVSFKYDTVDETDQTMMFTAIPAGGHSIQRFHYRWIANFRAKGVEYKFSSSDKV